tara:strand:- start:1310 stop:1807 length:498 start_codon:yes stop_codon:yes gene_type:complete
MWTVIKFDKKNLNLLLSDLKRKSGKELIIYRPKILIQRFSKNKLTFKEHYLLGDYLFFYHPDFKDKSATEKYKFSRGLKYFLNGFNEFQLDIKKFIDKCKKLENEKGYVSETLFDLSLNSSYKFNSGPFVNKIFKIIDFEKNKIKILAGNLKTTISKREYLFSPV